MRYIAVLTVLALTLLGCGGSDSDTDSATTPTTSSASGNNNTTTSQSPATTDGPSSDFSPTNCPELMAWANDSVMASQAAFAGGGTNSAGLEFTADYFQEFADRAPDEIRDDMQLFADAFSSFFETLEDMDIDFADPSTFAALSEEDIQELEAAAALMDTDEIEQATDNIAAFFERECS